MHLLLTVKIVRNQYNKFLIYCHSFLAELKQICELPKTRHVCKVPRYLLGHVSIIDAVHYRFDQLLQTDRLNALATPFQQNLQHSIVRSEHVSY